MVHKITNELPYIEYVVASSFGKGVNKKLICLIVDEKISYQVIEHNFILLTTCVFNDAVKKYNRI